MFCDWVPQEVLHLLCLRQRGSQESDVLPDSLWLQDQCLERELVLSAVIKKGILAPSGVQAQVGYIGTQAFFLA